MRTVHKFPLRVGETLMISVHGTAPNMDGERESHAPVVLAGEQRGNPMIWIDVDTDAALVERAFRVVGTGWEVPADAAHVASFQSVSGVFVWHVFEIFYGETGNGS